MNETKSCLEGACWRNAPAPGRRRQGEFRAKPAPDPMPALWQKLSKRRDRVPRCQLRGKEGRGGNRRWRRRRIKRSRAAGDTRGESTSGESAGKNSRRVRLKDETEQFGAGGEEGRAAHVLGKENAFFLLLRPSGVSDLQREVRQERNRGTRGQLRRGGLRVTQGLRSARQREA